MAFPKTRYDRARRVLKKTRSRLSSPISAMRLACRYSPARSLQRSQGLLRPFMRKPKVDSWSGWSKRQRRNSSPRFHSCCPKCSPHLTHMSVALSSSIRSHSSTCHAPHAVFGHCVSSVPWFESCQSCRIPFSSSLFDGLERKISFLSTKALVRAARRRVGSPEEPTF
jgi:hypothetical protein